MKRIISIICILMLVLALPISVAADQPAYLSAEEWEVLSLVNQERAKQNLKPLSVFDELQAAADLRATEIVSKFSHTRPNGEDCFTALDGISYTTAAENIAAGYGTPANVMAGWMDSTGHRNNILKSDVKHLGAGYYYQSGSEYTRYWTQLFIGGCTTTSVNNVGSAPLFDRNGNLISTEAMLSVTCNLHGTSYVALKDVTYYCRPNQYGSVTYTVSYDGINKSLPCTVGYSDLNSDAWYSESIQYAVDNGLMNGMTATTFAPDATMTRAQLVTVLHRLENTPAPTESAGFTDVASNAWFADAVNWAYEVGLVNGVGENRFAPDKAITRAELAAILLRFHQKHNPGEPDLASLDGFADGNSVPAWAKTSLQWAVKQGLVNGIPKNGATYVDFDGSATRAQVATILMRYLES